MEKQKSMHFIRNQNIDLTFHRQSVQYYLTQLSTDRFNNDNQIIVCSLNFIVSNLQIHLLPSSNFSMEKKWIENAIDKSKTLEFSLGANTSTIQESLLKTKLDKRTDSRE